MTTFDKYLLIRFLSVFGILLVSTFGLFVVIDGFTNVDAFQEGRHSAWDVLVRMTGYYLCQSSSFFDMIASIVSLMSVMVVFALLQRHGEIQPLLAAGVPTYRLVLPILAGVTVVSGLIVINRETIIPRVAHQLQSSRSDTKGHTQLVVPVADYQTGIRIGGKLLHLKERKIEGARFTLPFPTITSDLTTLQAKEATFFGRTEKRPGGWALTDVTPSFEQVFPDLTDAGKKCVFKTRKPNQIFVATDISFDQLSNRSRNFLFVPTAELLQRIHNPAYGNNSVRGLTLHLHSRVVRPLMDLLAVLVAVPLIMRRESRGLVGNMALCAGTLGVLLAISQGANYLGSVNLVSTDLAPWIPLIITGSLGAWLSGVLQT